jgi:outer membrane protein TolC
MNKIICLTILTLYSFAPAFAQVNAGGAIQLADITDAWSVALKNNPNKQVYDLNVQKAKADFKTAESFLYPTVSASATGQDNLAIAVTPVPGAIVNQPGKTLYLKFGKQYVYNGGFTVSRTLLNWQAMAQARTAKNNIALNQAQADAYVQALKQQTAQYYYTALVAKAAVEISSNDLSVADSVVKTIQQRLNEGLTDSASVNSALINYNQVLQNKLQNQELLDESLQNLRMALGVANSNTFIIKQKVNLTAYEDAGYPALGTDKNLLVYPHQLTIAELNEKAQKNAYTPQLSLSAYLGKQQFGDDLVPSFSNGAWVNYQYVGLNINVPIFTGFSTKNKIKSAEVSKSITEQQYKAAQQQSQANDSIVLARAANYRTMCAASADNFKLYYANCQLNKQKFEEGMISIDVYLKSFQDYLNAENTHLNNLSSLYSNYAVILSRQ